MSIVRGFLRLFQGRLGWVIRIGFTVLLLAFLLTRIDLNQLVQDIQQMNPLWFLVALVFQAGAIFSSILRWNALLLGQGIRVPMSHLVSTFLVGRFFGTFLPSTLGLDAYRAYDIARRAHATVDSVTVILVEKIIGFFALSLLIVVTVPAGVNILPVAVLVPVFLIFSVPVTIALALLIKPGILVWFLGLNLPGTKKFEGKLQQIARAVSAYEHQKRLLAVAVFFGVLVHLFTTLVYYFTALSVNAPAQLTDILFVGPLMIAATVGLPTIGGEGAREWTFVGLLGRIGVPESQAFLLGHLGFWCGMILSLPGGVIYALRPDTYRPDIQRVGAEAETPPADPGTGEQA